MNIIATRKDLDSAIGTKEHEKFMLYLKLSIDKTINVAVYPDGYFDPGYQGEKIEPIYKQVKDYSAVESFGFNKEDFE